MGHPQGRRIRAPRDEFGGSSGGKKLVVSYRDRDTPFHGLNFVRIHGASELLDQSTAPVSEFA